MTPPGGSGPAASRRSVVLAATAAAAGFGIPAAGPARGGGGGAAFDSAALAATALGFPSRPVRFVVPFAGGGATDATARLLAEAVAPALGVPVVVDNRPGVGGARGAEIVARAEPDGHTLLVCTVGTAAINPHLYPSLPYDPERDLAAVALVSAVPNGIIVPAGGPAGTAAELLVLGRSRPLVFGSPGNGTSGHLTGEYLGFRHGVAMTHVPYRGTGQLVPDLVAGRLDMAVDNLPAYLPQVRAGRLRLLVVTSARRWGAVPEVPTVAEAGGVPDFEAVAWFGLQAPARTPAPLVARLAGVVLDALDGPGLAGALREIGSEPRPLGPEAFAGFIAAENEKWRAVVRASGARPD